MPATEFDIAADKETFAMALLRRWGSAKPEDALKACNNLPEGEERLLAYTSALIGWTKVDPRAASEWVTANLNSIYRITAAGAVGRTWVKKDTEDAARWASAWPDEIEKLFILGEVLEDWGVEYGQEAAEWLGIMADEKMKDLMMSKMILKWGGNYPKYASD